MHTAPVESPDFASFDEALEAFLAFINRIFEKMANEHLRYSADPEDKDAYYRPLELERGPKYIRLVSVNGNSRSAFGFISRENGDLLKAASWKSPAKNFRRGNIFQIDSYESRPGNFTYSIS